MPRMVHKQKGPFGETIYTDENFRVIGTSHKACSAKKFFSTKISNMLAASKKVFSERMYTWTRITMWLDMEGKDCQAQKYL